MPNCLPRFTALLALACLSAPLRAATFTWSTTAADGSMNTGSNWSGGVAPATSGDSLVFSSSTTTAIINDYSSLSLTGLTLGTGFTLSGNAITIGGSISGASGGATINTNLIFSANTSFGQPNADSMTVNGVISGAFRLTKTGAGMLTLSGANTFSGNVQINNGTVRLSGSGTLGSSSNTITFFSAGKLDLYGTHQIIGGLSGPGTIFNNLIASAATLTIGHGNATGSTFSGSIADNTSGTGTVAVVKTGTGTMTLSGANTYSGGTTIASGTLELGAANALLSTGTLTLGGGTLATGGLGQVLGTLTLSASSTIDFGSGNSALSFADSSGLAWSGTLTITNYTVGTDTLRFGSSNTALTSTQLSLINFGGGLVAQIDANGYVTGSSVPEPSTYATIVGAAMLGAALRRRNRHKRDLTTPARR